MRWHIAAAVLGAVLPFIAVVEDAAAQRITHERDGRNYTYDFSQQSQSTASLEGQHGRRKTRVPWKPPQYARPLARGPKNIPWDEPGRNEGVPGLGGSSRSLSLSSAAPQRHPSGRGSVRADGAPVRSEEPGDRDVKPSAESGPRSQEPAGEARSYRGMETVGRDHIDGSATSGVRASRADELPDASKAQGAAPEERAKTIAEAKLRALAEEQRRLEREKSRDRHARQSGPRSSSHNAKASSRDLTDPDTTGAIAGSPMSADTDGSKTATTTLAQPVPAGRVWKHGVCRAILFGMMPGC